MVLICIWSTCGAIITRAPWVTCKMEYREQLTLNRQTCEVNVPLNC